MKTLVAVLASFAFVAPAQAQNAPIRLIVPYAAGGNTDVAARIVAAGLQQQLGEPAIVENRTGAGGMIAGELVAKAAPDGRTLFFTSNGPILHSPVIYNRPVYQWDRDFIPVSSVSFTPMVLVAHPSVPAKDLRELIALAKAQQGRITMATPGAGSTNHLTSELLQMTVGATWTHVHYKGTAPAANDLLGGHVQLAFDQLSVATPSIREGKLRAIAVTMPKRARALPDVQTFTEAGVAGFEIATFTGVFAPAKTPPEVVARLNRAVAKVLEDKAVREKFDAMGAQARASSPEAFLSYLKKEDAKWGKVIEKGNIRAN